MNNRIPTEFIDSYIINSVPQPLPTVNEVQVELRIKNITAAKQLVKAFLGCG